VRIVVNSRSELSETPRNPLGFLLRRSPPVCFWKVGNTVLSVFLLSARKEEIMPGEENEQSVHNGENQASLRLKAFLSVIRLIIRHA